MALIVITGSHEALRKKIEYAIDAEVAEEWSYAGEHNFVCCARLAEGVRFRPTIEGDAVVFGIVAAPGVPLTPFSYARAHSSFAELLLSHADDSFDSLEITARPCEHDDIE